jgi:SAM-dependent methyltransferase
MSSFYAGHDLEVLMDLDRYTDWILSDFRPFLGSAVVEIGAGIGNVAQRFVGDAERVLLVEPAANLGEQLLDRMSIHPHVETLCGTSTDVDLGRHGGAFDTAIMVNVLEHIEDDSGALKDIWRLLRPGGALCIFVPALPWLFGSLDEVLCHHRRYTRASLAEVIEGAGFILDHQRYFDVLGLLPWLITGRLLRLRRIDPVAARIYDRFGVFLSQKIERIMAPPLAKSLIAIARKPSYEARGDRG